MTVKEQIIRRVLDMDDAQAEETLARITVASPTGDERRSGGDSDSDVWAAFVAEREERVRQALAKSPEERTPFEQLGIDEADRRARLAGTSKLEAEEAETRRSVERIARVRPVEDAHPIWDMVGMLKADPNAPRTNVAENVDEYLAEIYADLHEDDDAR